VRVVKGGKEEGPEGVTGMTVGEVQTDARETFADAAPDLEEAEAQGIELEGGVPQGAQSTAQGVE
jgi:hypothetical protein